MQKLEKSGTVSIYAIAVILGLLILNQGGYFAGGIISAGFVVSLVLFCPKLRFKAIDVLLLAFSLWYLFCSLKGGFDIRYAAKGILPFLCLMFKLLLPRDSKEAAKLCEKVLKVSFYITVVAILVSVYSCVTSMRLMRLVFPFQYANTSGIFFGVMFILSRYAGFEWARKRQYVFFVALVLTQSVGAVGLTVLAEIFMSRSIKRTVAVIAVILAGAVFLKDRIYESIGTFVERFLQMYDGLLCMAENPLLGIGAGRWELAKNLYQTGFYEAREIHSSIVQVGVSSGIIGIVLFAAVIVTALCKVRFSNKAYLVGILMILCHSFLDFTLSFVASGFLVFVLLSCGESVDRDIFEIKAAVKPAVLCVITLMFFVLSVGMYQIKALDGLNVTKKYTSYIKYYESNPLSRQSVDTTENYAKALYATGNKEACLNEIDNIDVLSSNMIVLKKGCCGDWRDVLNHLQEQPYNATLYKTICYKSDDESLKEEVEDMLEESIRSMSFLGKILFEFKGEQIL